MKVPFSDRMSKIEQCRNVLGWVMSWQGDGLDDETDAYVSFRGDGTHVKLIVIHSFGCAAAMYGDTDDHINEKVAGPFPSTEQEVHAALDEIKARAVADYEYSLKSKVGFGLLIAALNEGIGVANAEGMEAVRESALRSHDGESKNVVH